MKKKCCCAEPFWVTAQTILRKKKLYCKVPIVLQRKGLEGLAGLRVFVLQYKLYCKLVVSQYTRVYCD